MANPDFVQTVLDSLDTNWQTTNYDPKPLLIDGDEMRDNADDSRVRNQDVVLNQNVVTVGSDPTGQNEPIGTEFDFRSDFGVEVSVEGYHTDGGGQIADKDDFNSLVSEVRRAILVDREFPVGDYTYLTIESENDNSPQDNNKADYFWYVMEARFHGFESLP